MPHGLLTLQVRTNRQLTVWTILCFVSSDVMWMLPFKAGPSKDLLSVSLYYMDLSVFKFVLSRTYTLEVDRNKNFITGSETYH